MHALGLNECDLTPTSHHILGVTMTIMNIVGVFFTKLSKESAATCSSQMIYASKNITGFYLSHQALHELVSLPPSFSAPQSSINQQNNSLHGDCGLISIKYPWLFNMQVHNKACTWHLAYSPRCLLQTTKGTTWILAPNHNCQKLLWYDTDDASCQATDAYTSHSYKRQYPAQTHFRMLDFKLSHLDAKRKLLDMIQNAQN